MRVAVVLLTFFVAGTTFVMLLGQRLKTLLDCEGFIVFFFVHKGNFVAVVERENTRKEGS